jgi:hypothetical protein
VQKGAGSIKKYREVQRSTEKYRGYRYVQLFFQDPFDFFSETYMIFAE